MKNLTLIIPGLLGPDARFHDDYVPSLPALEFLLCRAKHKVYFNSNTEYHRTVANRMGLNIAVNEDVPVAAITRYMDNDGDTSGVWMRADPVHLSADRDGLILMDSFILNLNQHDALAIASEVNMILSDYGFSLEVPFEDRWYIQMDSELALTTTELSSVVGGEITAYLPRGEGLEKIHSILNEVQMHLFNSEINQQREERGELPVNSIWLWGMGRLGEISNSGYSVMFSDDVFASCLGKLTSTATYPAPNHYLGMLEQCDNEDNVLAILMHCQAPRQYQNLELWQKALMLLEGSWFNPAMDCLEQGKLKNLRIITDEQEFTLNKFSLKKFWKKPQPITHYKRFPLYAKDN